MPNGFFKQSKMETDTDSDTEVSTQTIDVCIQVPSTLDLQAMRYMPAGADEDQSQRLSNMTKVVQESSNAPIVTSEANELSSSWVKLFKAIDEGNLKEALDCFESIPESDMLVKVLKSVHTEKYLRGIIQNCILAHKTGIKRLNADIVITPKTFEILIRDCATTMMNPAKSIFSFGLPSHHAYTDFGSGFCVFNKTAMLIQKAELESNNSLQYVVIGTDVNRDNGLCYILRNNFSHLPICHIDIFDSRVYPLQNKTDISSEFSNSGTSREQKTHKWSSDQYDYFMVDLKDTYRKKVGVHPALLFALSQLKEKVEIAKKDGKKIALFLPTGWDSHENETAPCGKYVNGSMMGKTSSHNYRFNDGDLSYFYEEIFKLYTNNPDCFASMYWGLEGGYDTDMYQNEVQLLMQLIDNQLMPNVSNAAHLKQL